MDHIAIFSGDRDWDDPKPVEIVMRGFLHKWGPRLLVVHGGAKGLDTIADTCARRLGLDPVVFEADWDRYGPSAGPRRNGTMLRVCLEDPSARVEICVGFHNAIMGKTPRGNERGTKNMLDLAHKHGVRTWLVTGWPW